VLRLALPHVTLLFVSLLYAAFGGWILTIIQYSDQATHDAELFEKFESTRVNFTRFIVSINTSRSSVLEERLNIFVDDLHTLYSRNPFPWSRNFTVSFV
ncbi:hypothetical protein NECAME_18897, partial [Necator americanus]